MGFLNLCHCFPGSLGSGKNQHCQVAKYIFPISQIVVFQIKGEIGALIYNLRDSGSLYRGAGPENREAGERACLFVPPLANVLACCVAPAFLLTY